MGTSSGLKTWYLAQHGVKNRLAMINMLFGESLIGDVIVNNSMDLQSTGSLLKISTQNVESSLDDDKLYKFKEGDFKRLCIQDIKDMLLLLVQGKLTNLMVEERFAFNVSLRMFTRSIVIQRRMEDLQLGVESYQKKLNLKKSDTYHSDLKRKEAYTAFFNPREFIYQNKDKQNRHMYSNPMMQPELKGSTQGYPLVSVKVLRYDKRSKSKNIRIVSTEIELILEQTQQGISHEVSVSAERVEE
nr:hypothetical protein [Tanacetum cinerariifolium]